MKLDTDGVAACAVLVLRKLGTPNLEGFSPTLLRRLVTRGMMDTDEVRRNVESVRPKRLSRSVVCRFWLVSRCEGSAGE